MTDNNTRKFSRTMDQAFPFGINYACAVERRDTTGDALVRIVFALAVGIGGAALLVHWLSK